MTQSASTKLDQGEGNPDPFTRDSFADMWDDWTESEYRLVDDVSAFLDTAERLGLAEYVPVDDDALDDTFASERGIEPGGMMWQLTGAGWARYRSCRKETGA